MIKTQSFDKVEVSSCEELRSWLINNHSQSESIWLVTFKKSEKDKYVSGWEVLDELICFGRIDGIRRKLDEIRTMQLISPGKAEHWARTYKERAAKLIANGEMHLSGFKTIEDSKTNGMWEFMEDVDNLITPEDLSQELLKHKGSVNFFNSINDSSKRFALRWIKLAKTNKTGKARI